MTVVTLVSVKGSPGVTTLACLLGATWPDGRTVAVVEADPSGGDLTARFQLSTHRGWSSFTTAARRSEGKVPLDDHLQQLPGGVEVLVQPGAGRPPVDRYAVDAVLASLAIGDPDLVGGQDRRDLVVDAGRYLARCEEPDPSTDDLSWLEHSDLVVVMARRDPPSLVTLRDRVPPLVDRWGARLRLVVVGPGPHRAAAIERFTGLPVVGELPFDRSAAQVVCGEGGSRRRLSRSLLLASSRRLAQTLGGPVTDPNEGPKAATTSRAGKARLLRRVPASVRRPSDPGVEGTVPSPARADRSAREEAVG